ncbi:MAG: hypothetical protein U0031_06745 [Thermomicrobiales bacterium]
MDASHFDRLVQKLAKSGSRRWLLRALAIAPLVATLTRPSGESEARKGSYAGRLGGRHGKNHRGREHDHRNRDKQEPNNPPPQSRPHGVCRPNGDLCVGPDARCCEHLTCTASIIGVPSCQAACQSDADCERIYPNTQTGCLGDPFGCPFIEGGKCCTRVVCLRDADCKRGFECRGGLCRRKV